MGFSPQYELFAILCYAYRQAVRNEPSDVTTHTTAKHPRTGYLVLRKDDLMALSVDAKDDQHVIRLPLTQNGPATLAIDGRVNHALACSPW